MNPKNVESLLLVENDSYSMLFKTALHYAECGLHVWFISPKTFARLPNIEPPDSEILRLITLVYFRDCKDLVKHLNGLHLWHKVPNVIILQKFESYSKIDSDEYNCTTAAFTCATLLDSASVCAKKNETKAYLIVAVSAPSEKHKGRLQVLYDMYFSHLVSGSDEKQVLDRIIDCLAING